MEKFENFANKSESLENKLSTELLAMAEKDQQMRTKARETNFKEWDEPIDVENTNRMKEIVEEIGWPTKSLVGKEAANRAWLLIQHADHDPEFQEYCLDLMRKAGGGEVEVSDIAFLEDRIRVNTGKKQLYGSQWGTKENGEYGPLPIENEDELDQRRKEIGLEPYEEYEKVMRSLAVDGDEFIFPNIDSEKGEVERVGQEFGIEDINGFVEKFNVIAQESKLVSLDNEMWEALENTDSLDIEQDDWERVEHHSVGGNPDAPRDWESIKQKLETKEILDAPIIVKLQGKLHLVSGNTRLMVSRAKGINPKVLLVDMESLRD